MKTFWLYFDILGLGGLIANSAVLLYVFFTAYSCEAKMTKVFIDKFGEANIEAVFLPLTLLWGLVAFIRFIWWRFKEY